MTTLTENSTTNERGFKKVLRGLDMMLFSICAILTIDTLAPSAAIGPSTISWWIITLVLFFIPYGLITAELGTTYPEQGGIYIWVKKAFGDRWAARTTWLYWINVALWMPSVYILFSGMFAQLFFPDMSLWMKIILAIVMCWITVYIDIVSLDIGKWVPNLGAILKGLVVVVLGAGAIIYASQHGIANDLSLSSVLPTINAGLFFLPVIVYNFMGFELMSGAAEEMENPGRDIPKAIITAGVLITFFYLFATVGILLALPLDQLGLIEGVIDTLRILFGESGVGGVIVLILGIAVLFSFLANMVTWTIGANRSMSEAASEGEMPSIFGKLHPKYLTPLSASIITGIVSSVVIVLYGLLATNAEDLFWSLFAFSSMVFLLPYLLLFSSFLKLRLSDPDRERPYRVPGGTLGAWILSIICILFIIQAIVFFVWVPGQEMDWGYAGPVLIGVIITLIIGEVMIALTKQKSESEVY